MFPELAWGKSDNFFECARKVALVVVAGLVAYLRTGFFPSRA